MMAMQRCVVCSSVTQCRQLMLPSTQRYVFVCSDLTSCVLHWINYTEFQKYERLATWLAEQETNDYLKCGVCAECGDMVYTTEDHFTYSGGRAHLHMQCFITRLNAQVWSSTNAITSNSPSHQHQDEQSKQR